MLSVIISLQNRLYSRDSIGWGVRCMCLFLEKGCNNQYFQYLYLYKIIFNARNILQGKEYFLRHGHIEVMGRFIAGFVANMHCLYQCWSSACGIGAVGMVQFSCTQLERFKFFFTQ